MSDHDRLPDDPMPFHDDWDIDTPAEIAERNLRRLLDETVLDDYGRHVLRTYYSPDDPLFTEGEQRPVGYNPDAQ